MKHRINFFSAIAISLLCMGSCSNSTQDSSVSNCADSTSVFNLGNGVNVSHWLSQSPKRGQERINQIQQKDIDSIASMGFNFIRIPIDEEHFFDEQMVRDEEGFTLLHNAIKWSLQNKMSVIVDLHVVRSHHFNNENNKPNSLFQNEEDQAKFIAIWKALQDDLSQFSTDSVAFEIMNEPVAPSCEDWNKLVDKFITAIRQKEPSRKLVIGSNYWQSPAAFDSLKVPADDKNLILSFHYYAPVLITHHRAPWDVHSFYEGKIQYPGLIIEDTSFYETLDPSQLAIMRRDNKFFDASEMEKDFEPAIHYADSLGLQLFCGEFGVYPSYIDKETRLRWYNDIVSVFRKHKISNCHWCYKGDFPVVNQDGTANELPAILTRE